MNRVSEQTIKELQLQIIELQKENEELRRRLNDTTLTKDQVQDLLRRIEKLEKQAKD